MMNTQHNFISSGSSLQVKRSILCCSVLAILFSSHTFANDQHAVLPTIAVSASKEAEPYKSGNMDIPRTEDDVQAYTIIEREDIERAGVTTVTELINKMLPMATTTPDHWSTTASQINLRGLGASQTLVLINGRRSAGTGKRGASEVTDQPNLNNIPLGAIERIEVLPTSAAAIYGSGAVGGVVNVILRKDYVGTDIDVRYSNMIHGDQPIKSVNLVSGFALEDGRTNVMITASKKEQDGLSSAEAGWKAKSREQILKNNPSSIYGKNANGTVINPPAGHLTNIRSKDGSELFAGWGSDIAHIPQGWTRADGISKLGKDYALGLSNTMGNWSGDNFIQDETTTESLGISINRDFTDKLNVFLEGNWDRETGQGYSVSPHTGFGSATLFKYLQEKNAKGQWVNSQTLNPNNPFGKDVLISYPVSWENAGEYTFDTFETEQKKIATGFTYNLTPEWLLSADYAWSQSDIFMRYARQGSSNPKAAEWQKDRYNDVDFLGDFTTQSTDILQKYWNRPHNKSRQTLNDMTVRATGPVAEWYTGKINLATGIEHRRYESEGYAEHQQVDGKDDPTKRKTQTTSVYSEFNIPLIAPEQNIPFAKLLDVQLAARWEDFKVQSNTPQYGKDPKTGFVNDFIGYKKVTDTSFNAVSPTVGFKFAPNDQIMLRASYSEGFVTPAAGELAEPSFSTNTSTSLIDPVTGKTLDATTSIYSGGNPELTPEKSKSYNVGLVLTPQIIENLRLSLDYYQIKKSNNISSITAQYILDNQDIYGNRIQRNAAGDVVSIDTTQFNALGLKTSGIDTNLAYSFDSVLGQTSFNLGYTYVNEYKEKTSLTAPETDYLKDGHVDYLKHRANASIHLQASDIWSFGWAAQYYGDYKITNTATILNQTGLKDQKELKIKDQMYHDVFAQAKIPLSKKVAGVLNSATVGFGVQNLFNDYRVDMAGTEGYISQYSDARGRQYFMNLKLSF